MPYIQTLSKLSLAILTYVLLGHLSRTYFTEAGDMISVIWLPSGFAMAILIIGGKKYLPTVFLGTLSVVLLHGGTLSIGLPVALGNSMAAFLGLWCLTHLTSFNCAFYRANDFFILVGVGILVAVIAAAMGVSSKWANGIIPRSDVLLGLLHWAQGDSFSVMALSPLILAWQKWPDDWFRKDRLQETTVFFASLVLVNGIVFLGWFNASIGLLARGYWLFLIISWAAVRFGIRGVTLVVATTSTLALLGASRFQGFFADDFKQTHFVNLWVYSMALSCVGMKLIQSIRQEAEVQASLVKMQDRFTQFIDAFPLPIALNDESQNIVHLNLEFINTFGYTLEDIPTLADWWVKAYPDPSYRHWVVAEWGARITEAARTGLAFRAFAIDIICKDGMVKNMLVSAAPLEEKLPKLHLVSFVDISERKQIEQDLANSEAHLRLSQEGGGIGTWEADLVNGKQTWSQNSFGLLGLENRTELQWADFVELIHPEDRQAVMDAVQAHLHHGKKYDVEYRSQNANGEVRWFRSSGQAIRDRNGLPQVMRGIVQDITERKCAEENLKASEREFRLLAEAMPQIVWVCRADGSNIYFNQQWVEYTGLSLEESYGHGWNIPFHPEDQQRAWDAWQNAVATQGEYALECRLRRADGEYRWWLIRGVPVIDQNGATLKWFGTCTDIHNLKLTEHALRDAESRWSFALEGNDQGVWDWDIANASVFFTPRWKSMLGFADDEISNQLEEWSERVHPDDLAAVIHDVEMHFKGLTSYYQNEHRVKHRSGEYLWILDRGIIVNRDATGKPLRMIGTHTDITERKKTEDALKQKTQLLADSQAIAHIGSWQVDVLNGQITWSDEGFRLYGLSPEHDQAPSWPGFLALLHADDRPAMQAWSDAILAGQQPAPLEFRTLPVDGAHRWLLGLGQLELGAEGKPLYMLGTVQDITEIKQLSSERQRWADAFRYCAHGIAIGNPETESIQTCNPSFARLLGYDNPEGMENIKISALYAPEWREKIKSCIQDADKGGENRYEGQMLRIDGSRLDVQIDLVSVKDTNQKVLYRVATIQDITARKRAEEKMRLQVSAMEASANAILIADRNGNVEWINHAFTTMTGYGFDEIHNTNYLDFMRSTEPHSYSQEMWRSVLSGKVWRGELINLHKDGSPYPVEQVVTPVFNEVGEIAHVIAIKQDVSERKAIAAALQQSLNNYQQLSNHLETVREEERVRIAREIHDELGGFLTALKIDLSFLKKQIPGDLSVCHEKTEEMKQNIHQGLRTIKRIINDLRPSILDHLGLIPALEWLAENLIKRADIACTLDLPNHMIDISDELKTAIFRITQEAFVNIVRYANASKVTMVLETGDSDFLITIIDNGIGITQEQMMKPSSFGIQGMRERVRYFGGDLTIDASPAMGTSIKISIPCDARSERSLP